MASILLDDIALTQHLVSISGGDWHTADETGSIYLGGSAIVVGVTHVVFTLNFTGTSISLYGRVLSDDFPTNDTVNGVVIDTWTSTTITLRQDNIVDLWYQSPILPDTNDTHTITFDDFPTMLIDYAVVSAGSKTILTGQTLLVDNTDPAIAYQGDWRTSTAIVAAANATSRAPVGGSICETTDGKASAVFQFVGIAIDRISWINADALTGTSVAVYGVSPTQEGVVMDYYLDGTVFKSRQYNASILDPNFLWFEKDDLDPMNHTLIMTFAIETIAKNFTLDFITYKPSFTTLADKPEFSPQSILKQGALKSQRTLNNIIVGSVVGPCIMALLLFTLWLWRKRRASIGAPMSEGDIFFAELM
ncbi:hypothetical protein H0H93_003050 [Arthromyces matolae]|nr:hypothetical protein H0H93_003050 [Arthromyces matolae]